MAEDVGQRTPTGWLLSILAVASAALPAVACAGTPGMTLDQQVVEYEVSGESAKAIRQSMNAKRQEAFGAGAAFDGYTKWYVDWNPRYRQRGGLCVPGVVEVPVRVVIQIPSLAEGKRSAEVEARWQGYREALMRHEQQHADIAVATGTAIFAALSDPTPEPCTSISSRRLDAAKAILAEAVIREREMDIETHHGADDGARFP